MNERIKNELKETIRLIKVYNNELIEDMSDVKPDYLFDFIKFTEEVYLTIKYDLRIAIYLLEELEKENEHSRTITK